eukprot:10709221-Heterocapsa_arctica.AAC.1
MPANFVSRLLSHIPYPTWGRIQIMSETSCRCKVKTVLVPSEGKQERADALIDSVYGPHSV